MRIFSRSRGSIILALVTLTMFIGGFAVYGIGFFHVTHARAAAYSTYTGTRGHLTFAGTTSIATAAAKKTATTAGKPTVRPMPFRPLPRSGGPTTKTATPSSSGLPTTRLSLTHNFDGINSTQNLNASGVGLEPPDEGLGYGNGLVINIVNLALAVYKPNGTLVAGPVSATNFFLEQVAFTNGTVTSDPRVYFDASTHTWFATIFEFDDGSVSGTASSHVDIAVNPSGNPLGTWYVYRIDTTDAIDNGCPCLPDYPQFGIDQYNVYISTNEFSIAGPQYNGAQIYAVSKSQLESLATAPNMVHFGNLSIAGVITYHVQPAISYTSAPAEFFMDSLDPNSTFDNRLGVWAMTNRQSVTSGTGLPVLSSTVITSEAYGFPPNAVTPPGFNGFFNEPTTGVVTNDFDAMQEVEYINGHLDGALDTAITIPGDTAERSGVAWFQVSPKLAGNIVSPNTSILEQGYVSSQGNYLLYPHINENQSGTMAMVFTLGGPGTYLSAAYATKSASSKQFTAVHLAAAGAAPDNGFTATSTFGGVGRWGDYSNGEVDPSGNFWLATEYIPGNGDQIANWGNRIFEVLA